MRAALLALASLSLACSSETSTTGRSQEELCSSAPIQNGDGTATMVGCSYEMHVYNITHHGEALTGAVARAADGTRVNVTHACGRYLLGKDPSGASVIIETTEGDVQSHGTVHSGQTTSPLTHLTVPITVER